MSLLVQGGAIRGGEPAPSEAEVLGALTGSRLEGVVLVGKAEAGFWRSLMLQVMDG